MDRAKKIVIITEKLITEDVTSIIDECGATGYSISSVGGKGSRGKRSADRDVLADTSANIRIEVIVPNEAMARKIAERIAKEYLINYSGIMFLEDVEVLRPEKFLS
jgi:nitrogen regulatory protein PII